jgi:hypothetical protein
LPFGPGCVDQPLRLLRIDHQVVDQVLVEEVVAHHSGRRVRDAAGDDPVPGTVQVAKLVSSVLRRFDAMELGRDLADH